MLRANFRRRAEDFLLKLTQMLPEGDCEPCAGTNFGPQKLCSTLERPEAMGQTP